MITTSFSGHSAYFRYSIVGVGLACLFLLVSSIPLNMVGLPFFRADAKACAAASILTWFAVMFRRVQVSEHIDPELVKLYVIRVGIGAIGAFLTAAVVALAHILNPNAAAFILGVALVAMPFASVLALRDLPQECGGNGIRWVARVFPLALVVWLSLAGKVTIPVVLGASGIDLHMLLAGATGCVVSLVVLVRSVWSRY